MRIQLELPEEDVKGLKDLMSSAKIATYKELFSVALTLLYWAVREVRSGRIIVSLDEKSGKYKELSMPALEALGQSGIGNRNQETPARTY